ncbi:MAG: orotidine 5'-phosphate decarboxylase [Micavibrio sp.]|nr:MAG: orotidine 5'-phosphate decarboxylase [Micavibrio sp.]
MTIFCAIDTTDLALAEELAATIGPVTGGLKLGLEFFNAHGPQGIAQVMATCEDAALFLDLKFHDIPNTVAGAVRAVSETLKPAYLNVHASGGTEMMKAAKDACATETKLLGVTILTSLSDIELGDIGYEGPAGTCVERLAHLAQQAGLDGVVCSAMEIEALRKACGPDFILMVPGIRPEDSAADDQKRVMGPAQAINAGATHLVIGRPITQADDPAQAAQAILDEINDQS